MEKIGIKTKEKKKEGLLFEGKKFVFTGALTKLSRPDASDLIKKKGGIVSSSISKNIDYVIVGENPGSKFEKAKKLNLKMIDENEFNELVSN